MLQINILSERKYELERRISALSDEREGLNVSLEESSDRILLLEKQNREQEQQVVIYKFMFFFSLCMYICMYV